MGLTAVSTSSTEKARNFPGWVVLGRVVAAHALSGQLKVRYFGGDPDNLERMAAVRLARSEDDAGAESYDVIAVMPGRRGEVRMSLSGVDSRDSAEELRGRLVVVEAAQLAKLPAGEYYDYQLVGCRVEAEDGRELGTVREIWSTGAPDVLVVIDERGAQHLIPAAEGLLREIDIDGGRIVIEIPPGLLGGE
jgi:16S rRNA processing protein RimM